MMLWLNNIGNYSGVNTIDKVRVKDKDNDKIKVKDKVNQD